MSSATSERLQVRCVWEMAEPFLTEKQGNRKFYQISKQINSLSVQKKVHQLDSVYPLCSHHSALISPSKGWLQQKTVKCSSVALGTCCSCISTCKVEGEGLPKLLIISGMIVQWIEQDVCLVFSGI